MRRSVLHLLVFLAIGSPAPLRAAPPLEPGVAEVQECAERNLPKRSARQRLALERTVQGADARRLEATLLWKRGADGFARVRVTVEAPQAERGTSFLLIEREGEDHMFSYLPEFRRVRRITSRAVSGSFLGTDLSYEDFQQLQGLSEHSRVSRLADGSLGGRPVYVLEAVAEAGSPSAYERVRSYFDRESCVLLRAEFSGPGAEREVEVAWPDVERVDGRWIPRRLVLHDLRKGSETRVSILDSEWDAELADRLFSEAELAKGH